MTLAASLQNLALISLPVLIYVLVSRWGRAVPFSELTKRLGLTIGTWRAYLVAVAATVPFLPLAMWMSRWTSTFEGSTIASFVGATPSSGVVGEAINYGLLGTGLPEELLFRGLIAGVLFRRISFWKANLAQATFFLLPHLLILLVAPKLWPLLIFPFAMAIVAGWLRHSSGSIGPAVVLHAAPNVVGALSVLHWG